MAARNKHKYEPEQLAATHWLLLHDGFGMSDVFGDMNHAQSRRLKINRQEISRTVEGPPTHNRTRLLLSLVRVPPQPLAIQIVQPPAQRVHCLLSGSRIASQPVSVYSPCVHPGREPRQVAEHGLNLGQQRVGSVAGLVG